MMDKWEVINNKQIMKFAEKSAELRELKKKW